MELGVSHEQNLSSSTPIVDNIFDKYNKNLVPIRSLSDHDIKVRVVWVRGCVENGCYSVGLWRCVGFHVGGDGFSGLCFDGMAVVPESVS